MDLLKSLRFPYQKRLQNKGPPRFGNKHSEGFSPGIFNKLCVTHSKSSNSGKLEQKSKLISFIFLKVTLKAIVVSDSWLKAYPL